MVLHRCRENIEILAKNKFFFCVSISIYIKVFCFFPKKITTHTHKNNDEHDYDDDVDGPIILIIPDIVLVLYVHHHFLIMSTLPKDQDCKLNHFLFIVRIDDRMFNGEKNFFTNNGDDRKGLDDDGGGLFVVLVVVVVDIFTTLSSSSSSFITVVLYNFE